jgi:hypothetical protein
MYGNSAKSPEIIRVSFFGRLEEGLLFVATCSEGLLLLPLDRNDKVEDG